MKRNPNQKRRSPKNLKVLNSFSGNFNIGLEVENAPVSELTLRPHQTTSADYTDVLGPAMSDQAGPLDVIGVEDPLGFDINTDVTGDVGF